MSSGYERYIDKVIIIIIIIIIYIFYVPFWSKGVTMRSQFE